MTQGPTSAGPRRPGADVQVELKIYVEVADEFEDLRGWMTGQHPGVAVTAVHAETGISGVREGR
jgi:hypothetical protein